MRLKLLLAASILFFLPFFATVTTHHSEGAGHGFTANAGRLVPSGRYCECGTQACVCDPGEEPCTQCPNQGLTIQPDYDTANPDTSIAPDASIGIGVLMLSVIFTLLIKRRM
jgi:hypothetical protein